MPRPRYIDRVHVGVRRDQLHHLGDRVAGLAAGAVDRVGPAPARRQLGVDRRGRSSGSGSSRRPRSRVMASAVTTPHPPAVVSTTTFGPGGSGWVANVAAASNASSTVAARVDAGLAAGAVEHPVVGGQRAGVAGGGPRRRPRSRRPSPAPAACGRRPRRIARAGRARRRCPRRRPGRPRWRGRRRTSRGSRRRRPRRRCRRRRPG